MPSEYSGVTVIALIVNESVGSLHLMGLANGSLP